MGYIRASARLERNRRFGFSISKYTDSPDPEIVVDGDDQGTVRALFESGKLRDLIRSQPYLDVRFDRSMVSRLLGSRKAKLELSEWGQITDVEHLKSLLTYFVETLNEMHRSHTHVVCITPPPPLPYRRVMRSRSGLPKGALLGSTGRWPW